MIMGKKQCDEGQDKKLLSKIIKLNDYNVV